MVVRKDPNPQVCGHPNCFPCMIRAGAWQRKGVVYRVTCQTCLKEGAKVYFIGESSRTLFDRGLEHLTAIRNQNMKSPMVEHAVEKHQGELEFTIESLCFPKTSLQVQATEAMEIENHRAKFMVLNRRGEWGQNLPPRLTLEDANDEVRCSTVRKRQAKSAPKLRILSAPKN